MHDTHYAVYCSKERYTCDEVQPSLRSSNRGWTIRRRLAVSFSAGLFPLEPQAYAKTTSRLCSIGSGVIIHMRQSNSAQLKVSKRDYT
jgi:hypothetical protein